MNITLAVLQQKRAAGERIVSLTAYDYPSAMLQDAAGVDIIHVGDSLGTNILGYTDETEVTLADMLHHLNAVRRGVTQAYVMVDLSYHTYDTPAEAIANSRALIAAGADMVKLEERKDEVIRALVDHGIPVCGHIGLTPQTQVGEHRVQGRTFAAARELIEDARVIQAAGAGMLVLELVPEEIAAMITEAITIPTIGIGSGQYCSGQIQVVNDVLGITERKFRHSLHAETFRKRMTKVFAVYVDAVRGGQFPTDENVFHAEASDLEKLRAWVADSG